MFMAPCALKQPLVPNAKSSPSWQQTSSYRHIFHMLMLFWDEELQSFLQFWLSSVKLRSEALCIDTLWCKSKCDRNICFRCSLHLLLGPLHGKMLHAVFLLHRSTAEGQQQQKGRSVGGQDRRHMSQALPILIPILLTLKFGGKGEQK